MSLCYSVLFSCFFCLGCAAERSSNSFAKLHVVCFGGGEMVKAVVLVVEVEGWLRPWNALWMRCGWAEVCLSRMNWRGRNEPNQNSLVFGEYPCLLPYLTYTLYIFWFGFIAFSKEGEDELFDSFFGVYLYVFFLLVLLFYTWI